MILNVPPANPYTTKRKIENFICWLKPDDESIVDENDALCTLLADKHFNKTFLRISFKCTSKFCTDHKLFSLGCVSRVKKRKIVWHSKNPSREAISKQMVDLAVNTNIETADLTVFETNLDRLTSRFEINKLSKTLDAKVIEKTFNEQPVKKFFENKVKLSEFNNKNQKCIMSLPTKPKKSFRNEIEVKLENVISPENGDRRIIKISTANKQNEKTEKACPKNIVPRTQIIKPSYVCLKKNFCVKFNVNRRSFSKNIITKLPNVMQSKTPNRLDISKINSSNIKKNKSASDVSTTPFKRVLTKSLTQPVKISKTLNQSRGRKLDNSRKNFLQSNALVEIPKKIREIGDDAQDNHMDLLQKTKLVNISLTQDVDIKSSESKIIQIFENQAEKHKPQSESYLDISQPELWFLDKVLNGKVKSQGIQTDEASDNSNSARKSNDAKSRSNSREKDQTMLKTHTSDSHNSSEKKLDDDPDISISTHHVLGNFRPSDKNAMKIFKKYGEGKLFDFQSHDILNKDSNDISSSELWDMNSIYKGFMFSVSTQTDMSYENAGKRSRSYERSNSDNLVNKFQTENTYE